MLLSGQASPIVRADQPSDPEVGYIYPPGAAAGSTLDVRVGGFNWTPDLEFFVHDERIKLNVTGSLSRIMLPGPPYLTGTKAYFPAPMPRELTATVSIPPDMPPGPVHWQVANANGASKSGIFVVSNRLETLEGEAGQRQRLEQFPITVSGRLERHEEIDRYVIRTDRTSPMTCDVAARRLGGDFNVVVEVRDDDGRIVVDAADTRGRDAALTFIAEKNRDYVVSLRELDFRGNRAYVYRLSVTAGPRVVAAIPSGGSCGERRNLQLFGFGLDGRTSGLSEMMRHVEFPAEPQTWRCRSVAAFDSPEGQLEYETEYCLDVSAYPELQMSRDQMAIDVESLPVAVTGMRGRRGVPHYVRFSAAKDETWSIRAQARCDHVPLDLNVTLRDDDGKQLAENDDLPETVDSGLIWTAPKGGKYELMISDSSGSNQSDGAVYRLRIERPRPDFLLRVPQKFNVVQGGKAELTVQAIREDGFSGPIRLSFSGLPAGTSVPEGLTIPGETSELKIPVSAAADVPATASLVTVTGTATDDDREISRTAGTQTPTGLSEKVLVAVTMKPRIEISPFESDERTVHRGTTHLAPISTKRLDGFSGQATVQLDSIQSFKFRQGILTPDVVVPAGAESIFFPCFVPQICETLDAYRVLAIAVAPVPDVDGRIRYLVSRMPAPDNSIAITVEGALLKITPQVSGEEITIRPGETFDLPIRILRSAKLTVPLKIEVYPEGAPEAKWLEVDVPSQENEVNLRIAPPQIHSSNAPVTLVICATATLPDSVPELDDVSRAAAMPSSMVEILKKGFLPVMADARVKVYTIAAEKGAGLDDLP
jgi:hypothetical protein